ncbi:MAG: glycosyltransferase [Crocinitomicaceae bacterium]|nr:glycosyltransferase [Crocinitomicaceae bacterium]
MKVLLLSYTFPPTPGIGGRRWAKFAKFLKGKDVTFHVIHSKSSLVHGDFWSDDVKDNPSVKTYPINFRFNKILAADNPNLIQKVLYRVVMFWARRSKYNPFDNAAFSEKRVVKLGSRIIQKEGIDVIVVTAPPHNMLHIASQLKKKTGVKLVLDYRDLWNGHPTYSVYQKKTKKQLDYSLQQEKEALANADRIFAVNNGLKQALINLNEGNNPEKFQTIYNGFDPDDFHMEIPKSTSDKITMVFAGNIDINLVDIVTDFIKSFKALKESAPEIYTKFKLKLFIHTNAPDFLKYVQSQSDEGLEVNNHFLEKDEYYKLLRSTDIGVFFLSSVYSDAFITKFSDYVANENFIVQVGYEGECARYIKENNIGLTYHVGDGESFFRKLIEVNFAEAYKSYDARDFDLEKITEKVWQLLTELVAEN